MTTKLFVLALIAISTSIYAQEDPATAIWPDSAVSTVTTQVKDFSVTAGTVDGQPLYLESNRTGQFTMSQGSLGSKPVNTTTVRLNNLQLTTGTEGSEPVESIIFIPKKD